MALDSINLTLTLREDAVPPLAGSDVLRLALEQWLPPFFRPFECRGAIGPERIDHAATAAGAPTGAWLGEHVDDATPLTTIDAATTGIADLLTRQQAPEATVYLTLTGGLHHQPPLPGAVPGWYGHIVVRRPEVNEVALWNLARVTLRWQPTWHEFTLHFPVSGYPITRQAPLLDAEWRIQTAVDLAVVEANRTEIFSNAAKMRGLLGLKPEQAEWQLNAEDALDLEDREALRQWQARLQAGEA